MAEFINQQRGGVALDVNMSEEEEEAMLMDEQALEKQNTTKNTNIENTLGDDDDDEDITAQMPSSSSSSMMGLNLSTNLVNSKSLKRCLSVPIMHTLPSASMTTRSATAAAAAAAAVAAAIVNCKSSGKFEHLLETPKKNGSKSCATPPESNLSNSQLAYSSAMHQHHIGIPRSNPCSREVSPAPVFNIFAPRARRYSASFSPLGVAIGSSSAVGSASGSPLCLTPRVSQLRQEECVDMNSREVNHEREVHSAMQMSQSWEDLTLVAENWSCKSDEFSNPLQVVLPAAGVTSCSSPSPTSNRAGLRLPYGLSPSPTRRTFATRRSMSPIAMRPSQLGPVKRKFELDDNSSSNWNVYSSPPLKKIFTDSRGSSPVGQSPTSVCPSPDSGTYDGRSTPKLFISKLCTSNNNNNMNSACSSPVSASPNNTTLEQAISSTTGLSFAAAVSGSSSISSGSEPMSLGSGSIDEGISIAEPYEKMLECVAGQSMLTGKPLAVQPMVTELNDDATLIDDIKSETSSIGGCSSISIDSISCDSVKPASAASMPATFLNRLIVDDVNGTLASGLGHKNFFINKQGLSGAKKYIVNHDHLPTSSASSTSSNGGGSSNSSISASAGAHNIASSSNADADADPDDDNVIADAAGVVALDTAASTSSY